MARFPLEASEIERFTPPSLANIPTPPVFLLRAGSRRDRRTYQRLLIEEGLTHHSQDKFRAETIRGLQALWSPEIYEQHVPRLKHFWEAIDQHAEAQKGKDTPDPFVFDPDEQSALAELNSRITKAWAPLRKLAADNILYSSEAPSVMLSILLVGWEHAQISYARADGRVSLDLLEELEDALADMEQQHAGIEGVGMPGTAFMQIATKATNRLFLDESMEKNSASPPPSSATPPDSKTDGKGKALGTSKASATSKTTPAA